MKTLRDKVGIYGVGNLTDAELVAVLTDDAPLAERLLANHSLAEIADMDLPRLRMCEGFGLRNATKVAAAAELGRRIAAIEGEQVESIATGADALRTLRPLFEGVGHEECWALMLTSSNRVIERMRVSQGGIQATVVDYRLIVRRALELLATRIIIAHNHPSGSALPSEADKQMTQRLREAAALFDITLLDHIIIASSGESFSFQQGGLL